MLPHPKWYQFKQALHSTPLVRYVIFFWHPGHTFLSPSFSTVNFGISFFNAGSYSLSHKLTSITAREAPIVKSSSCTYHKPLHLKCTLLTAKFSSFFIVFRDVSGGLTCSYNLLRAISTASLSGTLVYKLFTSREIILSWESSSVFSKISLAIWVFFSMFAPSISSKYFANVFLGCHMSYHVKKERHEVVCLLCVLLLIYTA